MATRGRDIFAPGCPTPLGGRPIPHPTAAPHPPGGPQNHPEAPVGSFIPCPRDEEHLALTGWGEEDEKGEKQEPKCVHRAPEHGEVFFFCSNFLKMFVFKRKTRASGWFCRRMWRHDFTAISAWRPCPLCNWVYLGAQIPPKLWTLELEKFRFPGKVGVAAGTKGTLVSLCVTNVPGAPGERIQYRKAPGGSEECNSSAGREGWESWDCSAWRREIPFIPSGT